MCSSDLEGVFLSVGFLLLEPCISLSGVFGGVCEFFCLLACSLIRVSIYLVYLGQSTL